MDSEDEPLLFQATWDLGEFEEQEEEEEEKEKEGCCGRAEGVGRGEQFSRAVWWAVGWVYTHPWASGTVLVVGFLLPLALSAYMFLYCEPLDIDLSYSAFEVRSHSSAERFDALTIALKNQLGSWDRHRRDAEGFDFDSNALRDLLLLKLNRQGKDSPTGTNETSLPAALANIQTEVKQMQEKTTNITREQRIKKDMDGEKRVKVKSSNSVEEGNVTKTLDPSREFNQEGKDSTTVTKESGIPGSGQVETTVKPRQGYDFTREKRLKEVDNEEGDVRNGSGRSLSRKRRFAGYSYLQTQALWRIELVFVAQGDEDKNIFTPERLHTIHHVERLLMQHPQFQQFCWKPLEVLRDLPLGPSYCSPPSSLLSYLFPSERSGKIYFDGMGPDLADIHGESCVKL